MDYLVELECLLPQLPEAVQQRRLGDSLKRAAEDLKGAQQVAEDLRCSTEIAELIDYRDDQLEEALERAEEIGEALENADSAERLAAALNDYRTELLASVRTLKSGVRARWRQVRSERFGPLLGVGELLSGMKGEISELGAQFVALNQNAMAVKDETSLKAMLEEVRLVFSEYERLKQVRGKLVGADEVGDFLNAVAEGRARLSMVSDAVRTWLERNGALDRFSVNAL